MIYIVYKLSRQKFIIFCYEFVEAEFFSNNEVEVEGSKVFFVKTDDRKDEA